MSRRRLACLSFRTSHGEIITRSRGARRYRASEASRAVARSSASSKPSSAACRHTCGTRESKVAACASRGLRLLKYDRDFLGGSLCAYLRQAMPVAPHLGVNFFYQFSQPLAGFRTRRAPHNAGCPGLRGPAHWRRRVRGRCCCTRDCSEGNKSARARWAKIIVLA